MPLVSIALSTYNGARYLREQLDSVLAQDVELEVVAVDDGSSDETPGILADYAGRDARLRWQPNPSNLGPTRSFQRVIGLCRGDFIAPCDQDDICLPGKLRTLLASMDGVDLAYCDSSYMDADGRDLGSRVSSSTRMLEGVDPLAFLFANSVSGHACLVTAECARAAMPFPAAAYHDWWLALFAAGRRGVRYVDVPLVRYRRHGAACSGMGRDAGRCGDWLALRRALVREYARRGGRLRAEVALIDGALDAGTGAGAALLRALWPRRASFRGRTGIASVDTLALVARLRRKLRRAAGPLPRAV